MNWHYPLRIPAQMIALALAALIFSPAITPSHSEQPIKITAREQAFYETLTFGPPLQGGALYAVLDPLSGRPDFVARLFPGLPGCFDTRVSGSEVTIHLTKSSDASKKVYEIIGIGTDFGRDMREEGDHIKAHWYHCLDRSHSLHTTRDRKHFLFKVAGQPMFAWSETGN